ncbi:MAG: hypothetical protein C5B54_09835 [Acidobacteria bacterium]|nr:MAG: hypothetical protein C5B54_09835 [Acidobacteriota bacterium]
MLEYLRELMNYEAWADAEFFRSWKAVADAHSDQDIRTRTDHMVRVQAAFLTFMKKETYEPPDPNRELLHLPDLLTRSIETHRNWKNFLASIREENLQQQFEVAWFKNSPVLPSFLEAITQVAFHTQGHRAQSLARLRTLGGEKVVLDWIVWLIKGKPSPQFPE